MHNGLHERLVQSYTEGFRVDEKGNVYNPNGRKMTLYPCNSRPRYLVFDFTRKRLGLKGMVKVHRLAALQWFGQEIFKPGIQVRHLNGNHEDNSKDNLAVGTAHDNMMDVSKETRLARSKKGTAAIRKLSQAEAQAMRTDRKNGFLQRELAEKYKVSTATVSNVCAGKYY